jgi:capsule assembly protein Wzi
MHKAQGVATWILLLALWSTSHCHAAPYDLVPRGDWSYDVLARWAVRGVVRRGQDHEAIPAREFHGDEPLTRKDMAVIVVGLAEHPDALPSEDRILLLQLVREFAPEIQLAKGDPAALIRSIEGESTKVALRPAYRGTGFALGRLGVSSDDGGTVRGVYRAAGLAAPNEYLLGQVSLTNARQLYSTDATAFPDLEHYVVRLHTRSVDWDLGKSSERWGPGWGGAMLLSDDAPALFRLNGKARFSLGFLGHDYTFEQFVATLDDTGGRRYIVARRLSRPFGPTAGASISEAVKTSSTKLLPLAMILPLYLAADLTFNDVRNSNEVNYLAGLDVWYAPKDSIRIYCDLVIDDITAPFGLGSYSVPRKIGMLFGLHLPKLNQGRTDLRLEWALTDGEQPGSSVREGGTYIHRNPTLDWFHDDLPIGHRMGQNRRGPFARLRHRFGSRFTAIGEWEDELQWRPTPAVGDRRRLVLYGAYDLRADRSVAVRMERTGGALGQDTLWEVQGAYSF